LFIHKHYQNRKLADSLPLFIGEPFKPEINDQNALLCEPAEQGRVFSDITGYTLAAGNCDYNSSFMVDQFGGMNQYVPLSLDWPTGVTAGKVFRPSSSGYAPPIPDLAYCT